MTRIWGLVASSLLLLTILVLVLRFDAAEGSYRVYVPAGYIKEVDRLIDEGKLIYDCRNERIVTGELTSAERYFYRNSYLSRDVSAWNDGDQRSLLVEREELPRGGCEGRLVAANASYHKQRLPTYVADTWRGSLFLRQSQGTTSLTSVNRTLEIVKTPWQLLPLPAKAFEDAWFNRNAEGIRSQRLAFKMLERGRAFATLKSVGDDAVLEVSGERPPQTLNGCPLPVGWRVRLEGGDTLRVEHPRIDHRYTVDTGREAALTSYVSLVNDQPRRKTLTDRLPMARDIAWAIDAAVVEGRAKAQREATEGSAEEDGSGRDDFDVHLTLDAFLNHRLERQLGAFCRQRYGRRPLRAAITVLEPESGRVLALPSYPTASDIDRLRDGGATVRGERLERNHNFLHHPVGSAAKPFLAAAALATRPGLESLEVPCFAGGEPPEDLLGYELGVYNLPPDCGGANKAGRIDFESFLTVSSNRYILFLGLLAMADWQGGQPLSERAADLLPELDRYVLAGRSRDRRPRLSIVREDEEPVDSQAEAAKPDGLLELKDIGDQAFMRSFRDLFDHRVHYRKSTVVDALDLRYWQPVIDVTLGDSRHPAAVSFSPITPEEVNLKANLIQQLRQDLYTTLLGNGNNRWSNLQLAQALARVVTGRPTRARLVERIVVPAESDSSQPDAQPDEILFDLETVLEAEKDASWPLPEAARERVLAGMSGVVERFNGTAHDLDDVLAAINAEAPEGVVYSALGKTGTPTSAFRSVERGPTTAAPAAVEIYSGNRQVKSGVLVLALRRTQNGTTRELVLSFFIDSQGGSEETVALAASLLRPLVESYWPEDWLQSTGV